jgi:hypothetical protein
MPKGTLLKKNVEELIQEISATLRLSFSVAEPELGPRRSALFPFHFFSYNFSFLDLRAILTFSFILRSFVSRNFLSTL